MIWRTKTARVAVLDALAEADGWCYAIDLQRATGMRWGLLYRALWSLHADGRVDSTLEPADPRTPISRRRTMYALVER